MLFDFLAPGKMARQKGFEPLAYCLEGSCSIQLSYWRISETVERVTGIEPASPAWKAGALAIVLHPHAPSVEIVSFVMIAHEGESVKKKIRFCLYFLHLFSKNFKGTAVKSRKTEARHQRRHRGGGKSSAALGATARPEWGQSGGPVLPRCLRMSTARPADPAPVAPLIDGGCC